MANNYINNKDFLECLVTYSKDCVESREKGENDPKVPNYLGECFTKIAEHLSRKPNFASYSFREEMVSDGIENCIRYFRKFDPEKSSNPFAYFTQIVYNTFLRRIDIEKKELYVRYKITEQSGILDEEELFNDSNGRMKQFEVYGNITDFINNFEKSREKKKLKKPKGIELFVDGDIIV